MLLLFESDFDGLPHGLLIAKLKAYGLSAGAVKLLDSYLSYRSQQIKLGAHTSSWEKEFPKVLFWGLSYSFFFINDIFYFIVQCILYNYADDNTLSFTHKDILHLKSVLEQEKSFTHTMV